MAGQSFASQFFSALRWLSILLFLFTGSVTWKLVSDGQTDFSGGNLHLLDLPRELCGVSSSQVADTPVITTASPVPASIAPNATDTTGTDPCRVEYERVTSNRTKGLTLDDLERSRALVGNRHRLAALAKTLEQRTKPITGVICGGSISIGHGVVPREMRYSDRLGVWLNDKYPLHVGTQEHQVFNRGSHGADMCAMAKRVNVMIRGLPVDPDLIVLEFAVNDYQGQDHKIHLDHKTDVFFEGFDQLVLCAEIVVHQLLTNYPKAAVMFLEMQTAIMNRKTAALLHMGVAKHYQVPVISYAETFYPDFYQLMDQLKDDEYSTLTTISSAGSSAGSSAVSFTGDPVLPYPHGCVPCLDQYIDPSFRPKGCKSLCVFAHRSGESHLKCDAPPPGRQPCYVSFLAHDAVHPSAMGHQMAADLIAETIAATSRDLCQGRTYPTHVLPKVGLMVGDPNMLAQKSNFVMVKDTMEIFHKQDPLNAKSNSPGFKRFGDSVDRPGWIATNPEGGETVVFEINLPQKPCYSVYLAILKSYEKMGTFTVTVKDLETNHETTMKGVDGLWKPKISVPNDMQITPDHGSPAGCTGKCTIQITTDPQKEGRAGNKVKIVTLSVRECVTTT